MIEAPKAQAQPVVTPRFTLLQLNNLLQLADQLMNPGVPYLHKLGCHEPAFDFFLLQLSEKLKCQSNRFDWLLNETTQVLARIQQTPSLLCEVDHVWTRLIKYVGMNANVLNLNDIAVICCRTVFINELKNLVAKSITETVNPQTQQKQFNFDKLDRPTTQIIFGEFLGQLLRMGFESSVQAIHNYFYLAKKIAKTESSGMSVDKISITISPTILHMLLLNNALCPYGGDVSTQMSKEMRFMTAFLNCLLRMNRFDMPYNPAIYKDYSQKQYNDLYALLMPTLTDPNQLAELLNKMSLKPTSPAQNNYSSIELKASLVKLDEKPFVPVQDKRFNRSQRSRDLKQTALIGDSSPIAERREIEPSAVEPNLAEVKAAAPKAAGPRAEEAIATQRPAESTSAEPLLFSDPLSIPQRVPTPVTESDKIRNNRP